VLGDVTEESFDRIWNGPRYKELREMILKGLVHPLCKTCVANMRTHGRSVFDKFSDYLE